MLIHGERRGRGRWKEDGGVVSFVRSGIAVLGGIRGPIIEARGGEEVGRDPNENFFTWAPAEHWEPRWRN